MSNNMDVNQQRVFHYCTIEVFNKDYNYKYLYYNYYITLPWIVLLLLHMLQPCFDSLNRFRMRMNFVPNLCTVLGAPLVHESCSSSGTTRSVFPPSAPDRCVICQHGPAAGLDGTFHRPRPSHCLFVALQSAITSGASGRGRGCC